MGISSFSIKVLPRLSQIAACLLTAALLPESRGDDPVISEGVDGQLHGNFPAVREPIKDYPLPKDGPVQQIGITSDAARLVIRQTVEIKNKKGPSQIMDRVSVLDLATGEQKKLQDWPGGVRGRRVMAILPDHSGVILEEPKEGAAALYDLATGKQLRLYKLPEGKEVGRLNVSPDGKRLAAPSRDFGAVFWNADDPEPHTLKLDFTNNDSGFLVWPLSGGEKLVVIALPAEQDQPVKVRVVTPSTGQVQKIVDGTQFSMEASPDGSRSFVLRQTGDDIQWNEVETWSFSSGEKTGSAKLQLPLTSIGNFPVTDGHVIFSHLYMVQQALVWNTTDGKIRGVVGPADGGFVTFAITPDGSKLAGVRGPWVEGDLKPEKISIYDTSSLVK